jgi:hypothetical protein
MCWHHQSIFWKRVWIDCKMKLMSKFTCKENAFVYSHSFKAT